MENAVAVCRASVDVLMEVVVGRAGKQIASAKTVCLAFLMAGAQAGMKQWMETR